MEIATLARTLPEIAASFDSLCEETGITETELAEAAQCAQSTIGRFRNAKAEPGIVLFTRAVLRLGKTPNELLLRAVAETPYRIEEFDEEENRYLARIKETFRSLKRKNPHGPVSPVIIFGEALFAVDETVPLPAPAVQATVQVHDDGVKTIDPAPKSERTRKGDSVKPENAKSVSEDAAEYEKPKPNPA